ISHIGKCSIMIVVIERAARLLVLERHLYRGGVREVEVRPAIAVIIDDQHTSAHRFHDVFLFRSCGVNEASAGLLLDVLELRNRTLAALDCFNARWDWRRRRMATLCPSRNSNL